MKGLGSPAFQPPEACQDDKWLQEPMKYDIWSAGIVLYIITTGQYPFEKPNLIVLWNNISNASYTIPDFIGPPLSELIEGMIEVDMHHRWSITKVKKHLWLRRSSSGTPSKTMREYKRSLSKKRQVSTEDKEASGEKDSEGGETLKLPAAKTATDTDRHLSSNGRSSRDCTTDTIVAKSRSRSLSNWTAEVPIKPLQTVFDEPTINSILQSLSTYEGGSTYSSNAEDDISDGKNGESESASGSQKRALPLKYIKGDSQKDKKCLIM